MASLTIIRGIRKIRPDYFWELYLTPVHLRANRRTTPETVGAAIAVVVGRIITPVTITALGTAKTLIRPHERPTRFSVGGCFAATVPIAGNAIVFRLTTLAAWMRILTVPTSFLDAGAWLHLFIPLHLATRTDVYKCSIAKLSYPSTLPTFLTQRSCIDVILKAESAIYVSALVALQLNPLYDCHFLSLSASMVSTDRIDTCRTRRKSALPC